MLVRAFIKAVFPWSTWPAVPIIRCFIGYLYIAFLIINSYLRNDLHSFTLDYGPDDVEGKFLFIKQGDERFQIVL